MDRRAFVGAIAGMALLVAACSGRTATPERRLVIENVTVVSPGVSRGAPVSVAIAGDRIVTIGSDTPAGPTYANPPGLNGYLELDRLAAGGVPLDRLLAAATIEAARAFRLDSLYGTVEVGKVANLLVLSRDPLEPVAVYDAIDLVVSRGRLIERASLVAPRREAR